MKVIPIEDSEFPSEQKMPYTKTQNRTDQNSFAKSVKGDEPQADRHILPSRGFFYDDQTDLTFRPFRVGDLRKIQRFIDTNNISHLIDTVNGCITSNFDARKLTTGDFLYILFRIVFDSYPSPEYRVTWTSFYGNKNETIITPNLLNIKELDVESFIKEFPDYRKYKLTPMLVEAWEVLYNSGYREGDTDPTRWTEDQTWFYEEVAAYLDEASPEEQRNRAEMMSTRSEEFIKLKKFKKLSEHNVEDTVEVIDKFFIADTAVATLQQRKETMLEIKKTSTSLYFDYVKKDNSMSLIAIEEEINRIQTALVEGKPVAALPETVTVPFDLPSLISPLLD